MYKWTEILGVKPGDLQEGGMVEVPADDRLIILLRQSARIFAFAAKCPHAGGRMCEGWLDIRGNVVCPLHKYRFNPANGHNTSGEGYKLLTYPVQVVEDVIFVGFLQA